MNYAVLFTILSTGFTISFFHASIPTHWLPFVLASRAQKWSSKKTLSVALLAGSGHILMTTILGVLIVWVGLQIDQTIGRHFAYFAGGILVLMGFYYYMRHRKGKTHSHFHVPFLEKLFPKHVHHHIGHCDHDHTHDHDHRNDYHHVDSHDHAGHEHLVVSGEGMTILGLFLLLTFSPCEGFLPVYVSGISFGWKGFLLLTLILGIGTVLGMIVFTWLALKGIERINVQFIEKNESLIMSILLVALGLLIIFVET